MIRRERLDDDPDDDDDDGDEVYFVDLTRDGHVFHVSWPPGQESLALAQAIRWAQNPDLCFTIIDAARVCAAMGVDLCRNSPTDTAKSGNPIATSRRGDGCAGS